MRKAASNMCASCEETSHWLLTVLSWSLCHHTTLSIFWDQIGHGSQTKVHLLPFKALLSASHQQSCVTLLGYLPQFLILCSSDVSARDVSTRVTKCDLIDDVESIHTSDPFCFQMRYFFDCTEWGCFSDRLDILVPLIGSDALVSNQIIDIWW